MRPTSLAPWLVALLPFVAAVPAARAEDAEPTEKKPEKPTKDDTSIFKDFKMAQGRGINYRKERAKFWEEKGVVGKDLYFLGRFWQIGEEWDKAVETFDKYFAWDPDADAAVADKDKEKARGDKEKNSEFARNELMEIHLRRKDFPKVVESAQKFRELHPGSSVVNGSYVQEGRAHRLAGDLDKAVEAFGKAAEAKIAKGLFDMLDLLMTEGRYDEAKAAFGRWQKEGEGKDFKDVYVNEMRAFVDAANTGGPDLGGLVSAGRVEMPALAGKPVLFYHWHMQVSVVDGKLRALDAIQRAVGDKAVVVGLATYHRYNPDISKVVEDMTPEQEVDWYKKFADVFKVPIACAVAPKEVLDALRLKYEAHMTIVDGEGKLRWSRISSDHPYDRWVAEIALKKIAGAN